MSTFNGEKYLQEQLNSLFNQENIKLDILVRDDNSTDKTKEILDRNHIKWYTGKNLKPAKSFFDLIKKSGDFEYYAFCDQDDVWDNKKLYIAIKKLEKCNNNKPSELEDKVIFINAKNEVTRKNAESYLEESHINKILSAYRFTDDVYDFKRTVDLSEIEKNHFDLTIQKYVFINEITNNETLTKEDAIKQWLDSSINTSSTYNSLIELLGDAV